MIFNMLSLIISIIVLGIILDAFYRLSRETKDKPLLITYAFMGVVFFIGQSNIIVKLMMELMG